MQVKLVARAVEEASGDSAVGVSPDAFDQLVCAHQRRIHRILLAFLHDTEAADTLTQECFLRAFQKRATFRGEADVGTWLVRIALNLARDHARNRRKALWRRFLPASRSGEDRAAAAASVPDPAPPPDRLVIARERLAAVHAAVDRLSHRQRTCFLLRFVEGMTLEEIAGALQVEIGTVKTHLARGVRSVRQWLNQWEGSCEDI